MLRLPHDGIALNEQFKGDGAMIYKHACALGWEGIVSKRLGSLSRWPFGSLVEDQEPRCTGGAAARRGRLGLMEGRPFPMPWSFSCSAARRTFSA